MPEGIETQLPVPSPETETLERRYYSQSERDKMDDSDFGDPAHQAFPIKTQQDVDNAARLIGHAAAPAAVKARIIAIATRKGFTLPQSWQEDEQHQDHKERAAMPTIDRAGNHAPMTGTHTHAHPAFGSQGGDETHEHEHSHSDDAVHDHSHDDAAASRAVAAPGAVTQSERVNMSLPLTRIDATKREVWGQATAEVPDSYGTIFGYYPDAWKSWRGNIREQHDGKKAVGRRVELECDEQARAIYVGSRISRGAQDTWLKVEDNVLTGYSASIIPDPEFGTDPRTWPKKEYQGKHYPYLPRYTVAELSLVDNPACPGCDIQIVRADGFITDITEEPEPEPATPAAVSTPELAPLERAGATISAATKSKLHDSIGHTLQAAKSQMQNCADAGCADCAAALKQIDPDDDGDIDAFGGAFGDTDGDAATLAAAGSDDSDMERTITGMVERVLDRALAPVYARLQGIAGTLARSHAGSSTPPAPVADLDTLISGAITRAVDAATIASSSSLDEVRAELSAVKGQVEVIAKQPMPGAPIQHAGTMPRSTEKRLATDPFQMQRRSGSPVFDALSEMRERGDLSTIQRQEDAATAALLAQRGGL